jgi:cation transport ATPase
MTDHHAAQEREKMATTTTTTTTAADTDNDRAGGRKRTEVVRLSLVAVVALASWLGPVLLTGRSPPPSPFLDVFAVAAALIGGYPVYVETFKALLRRQINMEVSMTIAIFASPSSSRDTPSKKGGRPSSSWRAPSRGWPW